MSGVLRGFAPAEYDLYASTKTPARHRLRLQARRAGLCGLAHQKNSSFMNWKLTQCPTLVTLFMDRH